MSGINTVFFSNNKRKEAKNGNDIGTCTYYVLHMTLSVGEARR